MNFRIGQVFSAVLVVFSATCFVSTSAECVMCSEMTWGYPTEAFNGYEVNATTLTPEGTPFDPSGMQISGELIDRLTGEVERCLQESFPDGKLPDRVAIDSECLQPRIARVPINRSSFEVKVVSDWVPSCDHTQQLLPTIAGPEGCVVKGLNPTEECPCRYRVGIACPNVLVVTPSMYLYKDVLVRFVTSCADPWASPELHKCVSPSTTPLSDGTDPKNGL